MPGGRVYLGIDSESKLAVSLEAAGHGVYFLTVSEASSGPGGADLCKFVCDDLKLGEVEKGGAFTISGKAGTCSVTSVGERVMIDFQEADGGRSCFSQLTAASYARLFSLVKNRAYAG
jgi:hypothetical protein